MATWLDESITYLLSLIDLTLHVFWVAIRLVHLFIYFFFGGDGGFGGTTAPYHHPLRSREQDMAW